LLASRSHLCVPTFALGLVRLILFKTYYEALALYRSDIIIPFDFVSMLIQACVFTWIYEKAFDCVQAISSSMAYPTAL